MTQESIAFERDPLAEKLITVLGDPTQLATAIERRAGVIHISRSPGASVKGDANGPVRRSGLIDGDFRIVPEETSWHEDAVGIALDLLRPPEEHYIPANYYPQARKLISATST